MRFSGKLALKVGAVGVAAGVILTPMTAANAAAPTLSATPSTGLADGASVAVSGTGFDPSVPFAVTECSALTGAAACDSAHPVTGTTGADGTITATFTVHTGTIGTGTCPPATATDPCYLAATTDFSGTDPSKAAVTPITFAAATTGPALTVTPATGVNSGDKVSVSGTGFPSDATSINLVECGSATPTVADCDVTTLATGTVTAGAFGPIMVTVHTGPVGDKTCDVGGTCYIVGSTSVTAQDATNTAVGSFAFAGATGPTVTVSPATGVKDGGTVTVSGTGFPASQPTVYILECSGTTGQDACDVATLTTSSTDKNGAFSGAKVTVHTGAVGNGKCNPGGLCYIAASTSTTPDPSASGAGTFTFAKGGATHKSAATKTKASFSKKKDAITGVVKAHGKGVKGVKTALELKKGSHWKKVGTAKTHKGGKFAYKHIKKSGTYEVKALKGAKTKASHSKHIKVKV